MNKKKNKSAVALGKLSAKARKGKTDYSAMAKKYWASLTPGQKKAKLDKMRKARNLTKK
jgi:hypothetical protein